MEPSANLQETSVELPLQREALAQSYMSFKPLTFSLVHEEVPSSHLPYVEYSIQQKAQLCLTCLLLVYSRLQSS